MNLDISRRLGVVFAVALLLAATVIAPVVAQDASPSAAPAVRARAAVEPGRRRRGVRGAGGLAGAGRRGDALDAGGVPHRRSSTGSGRASATPTSTRRRTGSTGRPSATSTRRSSSPRTTPTRSTSCWREMVALLDDPYTGFFAPEDLGRPREPSTPATAASARSWTPARPARAARACASRTSSTAARPRRRACRPRDRVVAVERRPLRPRR